MRKDLITMRRKGTLQRQTYYKTSTFQRGNVKYKLQVEQTDSQIKEYIKKANNWTDEQYRKQYDIFKNKLRAYESFRESHGASVSERQNVIDVLYKEAKAKMAHGAEYTPSMKMQQIRSFSAYSITKGREMAKNERYQKRQSAKYEEYVNSQFEGFIRDNKQAQRIIDEIKDPVKRERALRDLADKVKAVQDEQGKVEANEAQPYSGEAMGYAEVDFDIDAYK